MWPFKEKSVDTPTPDTPNPGPPDIAGLLLAVLTEREITAQRLVWETSDGSDHPDSVHLDDYKIMVTPILTDAAQMGDAIRATLVIYTAHESFTDTPFEYIHAMPSDTLEAAVTWGFDQWAQTDLPVLCDAVSEKPETCTMMEMSNDDPPLRRQIVLGPVAHMRSQPLDEDEEHPFCPCCLFTNSIDAFKALVLESDKTAGIRLFAARGDDGTPEADCRINGEDWEPGMEALRNYVKSWPGKGFEFRKQYIFVANQA